MKQNQIYENDVNDDWELKIKCNERVLKEAADLYD